MVSRRVVKNSATVIPGRRFRNSAAVIQRRARAITIKEFELKAAFGLAHQNHCRSVRGIPSMPADGVHGAPAMTTVPPSISFCWFLQVFESLKSLFPNHACIWGTLTSFPMLSATLLAQQAPPNNAVLAHMYTMRIHSCAHVHDAHTCTHVLCDAHLCKNVLLANNYDDDILSIVAPGIAIMAYR